MLILLFVTAALNLNAFSAPMTTSVNALDSLPPLSILGRDIPIPECVNPARYRTMQQIILSCLATIFACTWVSLHPNVPDPRNTRWQNFAMRIRTMFWALIGPEFITIWAFRQRKAATGHAMAYNEKFGREFLDADQHVCFSTPSVTPQPRSMSQWINDWFSKSDEERKSDRAWTRTYGFLMEMHGLVFVKDEQPLVHPPPWRDRSIWTERAEELKQAGKIQQAKQAENFRKFGIFSSPFPPRVLCNIHQVSGHCDISVEEINDKSKGDFFTKLIIVIQTSWFIIQCIARWVQRLHVTELEIVTLAFAVLNIITYILWWDKPQNMHVAIPIFDKCEGCRAAVEKNDKVDGGDTPGNHPPSERASLVDQYSSAEEQALLSDKEQNCQGHFASPPLIYLLYSMLNRAIRTAPYTCWVFIKAINPFPAYGVMIGDIEDELGQGPDIRTAFYSSTGGTSEGAVASSVALIGLLFGGVHLLPIWLSTFSSARDKSLWIASTICVLVEPVLVSLMIPIFFPLLILSGLPETLGYILIFPHTIGFLLYVISRLTLIVLAFANLGSLPSDAFANVEWSTFFPHI